MRNNVSDNLKKYLFSSKVGSLNSIIESLKSDLTAVLTEYMEIDGDLSVFADIDEEGDVNFRIAFSADEIYENGEVIRE
ncbi:MAG: hypothetical protein IJX05_04160 [Clostridia bacterium]|nr:hypothetical protein [Clostridia bacterium]